MVPQVDLSAGGDRAELYTAVVRESVPILAAMGLRVVEAGPLRAVVELPTGPNRNHLGTTYAGALYSAAEVLGGVIGFAQELEGFVPLLKRSEIDYLRPATTTVRATTELDADRAADLRARALAHGKADFELEVELSDEAGVVVARCTGTYQLRRA